MNEAPAAHASVQEANARQRRKRRVLVTVLSIAIPLCAGILLCVPNAGPVFRVLPTPSAKMAPTLPAYGFILVSRASYGYSRYSFDGFELPINGRWPVWVPRRGDVAVYRLKRNRKIIDAGRVVGLPGDTIQMINGRLSINGNLVPREPAPKMPDPFRGKAEVDAYTERLPEGAVYRILESDGDKGRYDHTREFVVPSGHLFVLGDNRDNSLDSRDQLPVVGHGFVPIELVIGRVIATF